MSPSGMDRRTQFNVRLSADELAELRELAAEAHLTVSDLLRLAALTWRGTARALASGDVTIEELRKRAEPMVQLRIEGT